jgi:hypothetical protein
MNVSALSGDFLDLDQAGTSYRCRFPLHSELRLIQEYSAAAIGRSPGKQSWHVKVAVDQ